MGWYWHLVERDLQARGYDAIAVDLAARGRIGLPAYADAVVDAIDGRAEVALIAQSMGAFTAPLVWQRVPTRLVVFVNTMIPLPGETPGEWWKNVGSEQARTATAVSSGYSVEFDLATYFLHDIPAELLPEMESHAACQLDERFDDRCDFDAWPAIPIHVVAGRDDRFFPLEFQRRNKAGYTFPARTESTRSPDPVARIRPSRRVGALTWHKSSSLEPRGSVAAPPLARVDAPVRRLLL